MLVATNKSPLRQSRAGGSLHVSECLMQKIARPDSAFKPWRHPDASAVPPLTHGAQNPATRSVPEVIQRAVILQEMLGHSAVRAQRHREPRSLLEAAALTTTDLAAEADDYSLAPGQIRIMAGVGLPGGTP
jgi:hypothetical protein